MNKEQEIKAMSRVKRFFIEYIVWAIFTWIGSGIVMYSYGYVPPKPLIFFLGMFIVALTSGVISKLMAMDTVKKHGEKLLKDIDKMEFNSNDNK